MKKSLSLVLSLIIALCCFVGCSSKWTDEDITKAHTVEITKYDGDDYNTKTIYTITDEETVRNLCNTFSIIELTDTRIKGTTKKAFYICFIGNGGEIDHVTIIQGNNTLQDRHGDLYKITDEMDIERHLNEVIETAPSEKDIVSGNETECVHTYGEWQYDETYHWCDWSCSLDLCDIDTTGEHIDKDENGICDKCGYFPAIHSDVTGFNLQKIVFASLESINRTPNNDSDVINGINETIKANSNAYDVIEFCFYYDGNVSEELFENMHHTDIVQANDPTRMIVRVKYNNINIEALKTLSQVSQITSIHISTVSELGVEPEPDVPLDSNNSQSGDSNNFVTIGTAVSDVMSSYAISCKILQEYSTDNTDIPILLSFGLIEGCDVDADSFSEIVLSAENDEGQTITIKRINISEMLESEYVVESVWDDNREWIIGFNYTHKESINLPLSLFSGESGQIHIGLYECSNTNSEKTNLGSGAYIVLHYTRNETSISITVKDR